MAIFEDEYGNRTYYYYKKKIGRPKKRGPKKKPKKRGKEHQEPWDYKIVKCDFKTQDKVVGVFHNLDEVEVAKRTLLKENKEVVFSKETSIRNKTKEIEEYNSEYIVLQRVRNEWQNNISKIRNSYGKLVNHETTNKKWKIVDKFPCLTEETFWVYGYNPRSDRKTFMWVNENYVKTPLSEDSLLIIRVQVYYNKLVLRYDSNDIEFVICRNHSDAVKFYNLLLKMYEKDKRVVFIGKVINKSDLGKKIIQLIQNKTGWTKSRITRTTTQ